MFNPYSPLSYTDSYTDSYAERRILGPTHDVEYCSTCPVIPRRFTIDDFCASTSDTIWTVHESPEYRLGDEHNMCLFNAFYETLRAFKTIRSPSVGVFKREYLHYLIDACLADNGIDNATRKRLISEELGFGSLGSGLTIECMARAGYQILLIEGTHDNTITSMRYYHSRSSDDHAQLSRYPPIIIYHRNNHFRYLLPINSRMMSFEHRSDLRSEIRNRAIYEFEADVRDVSLVLTTDPKSGALAIPFAKSIPSV
jgi:hypothetical protein